MVAYFLIEEQNYNFPQVKQEKTDWDWVNSFVDEPVLGIENLAKIQSLEDSIEKKKRDLGDWGNQDYVDLDDFKTNFSDLSGLNPSAR